MGKSLLIMSYSAIFAIKTIVFVSASSCMIRMETDIVELHVLLYNQLNWLIGDFICFICINTLFLGCCYEMISIFFMIKISIVTNVVVSFMLASFEDLETCLVLFILLIFLHLLEIIFVIRNIRGIIYLALKEYRNAVVIDSGILMSYNVRNCTRAVRVVRSIFILSKVFGVYTLELYKFGNFKFNWMHCLGFLIHLLFCFQEKMECKRYKLASLVILIAIFIDYTYQHLYSVNRKT